MTLQVPFDQFTASASRVLGIREAFVTRHTSGTLVTASTATARTVVAAITTLTSDEAKAKLKDKGFEVHDGMWSTEGLTNLEEDCPVEPYVVAIAYESGDGRPGIWVDAFTEQPTQVQALRAMYDELLETGELTPVSFEEFVRLANANVGIVTPSQLRGYIAGKAAPAASPCE